MKRALIIGSPGAGKSCFARRLSEKTGLPLIHLDQIWHCPDKTSIPRAEFDARLGELLCGDAWIIDGNYARTLPLRLVHADIVFLFDLPVEVCLAGVRARIGHAREDIPWVEETLDPEFREFIEKFPEETLPRIAALLQDFSGRLVIFHTRAEADAFLEQ